MVGRCVLGVVGEASSKKSGSSSAVLFSSPPTGERLVGEERERWEKGEKRPKGRAAVELAGKMGGVRRR